VGAWGLGWEVWCDGMEITQYTYFQQVGGLDVFPVAGELTIGLERLSLYLQNVDSVYDLRYNDEFTYGEVFLANEQQFSAFELEVADVDVFKRHFEDMERQVPIILGSRGRKGEQLVLPAYDHVLKASHMFNIMDARGAIRRGRTPELHRPHPRPLQDVRGDLRGPAGRERVMFEHVGHAAGATARARSLRRRMTWSEQKLWKELRKLEANFRRQAPIGRYFADFACHRPPLVIEVDGGVHERLPDVALRDFERQQWLEGEGYRVVRFTDRQVSDDVHACVATVKALLLDGGGLGGGEGSGLGPGALLGVDANSRLSVTAAATPPSPTLPPSRRKGA